MLVSTQIGVMEMKIINQKDAMIEKDICISSCSLVLEEKEHVLCNHCLRTASNGIRCMGICVADNEY